MKNIKKKRNVKEGSPFEEDYLIELLQEDRNAPSRTRTRSAL
jgi:hypothetical protein